MFCQNCGAQIDPMASICVHCGHKVTPVRKEDSGSALWWWLGFLVPLAGFLIWAICNDDFPAKAKKAGIGALWGVGVGVVLSILLEILYFVFIGVVLQSVLYV